MLAYLKGRNQSGSKAAAKLALVIDDDPINRLILKSLLNNAGYEVIQAENGADGVEKFIKEIPDIIFMDVMMPVMDGYQAAADIKRLSGEIFVPIIFLTGVTDEVSLKRCIEVGGDDFLTKPFNDTILISKINAMERIQSLMKETAKLTSQMQQEEETAEKIFSSAVTAPNDVSDYMRMVLKPAAIFSGDMMLASYTPAHDLDVLLGDFTSHGLTAAVGALPTSEIFHSMSKKGFTGAQILDEINRKLKLILPTGMFMAAQFVRISHELRHIEVCNCGMPDVLVLDAADRKIKHRIASVVLPLGIVDELDFQSSFQYVPVSSGDRIVLFSDGVIEARGGGGVDFGETRLEAELENSLASPFAIDNVYKVLREYLENYMQDDDISLMELICLPGLLPTWEMPDSKTVGQAVEKSEKGGAVREEIELSLVYHGERLRTTDPVPAIVNFIKNSPGVSRHREELFTVITELYVNALDHGVLGLDSSLKETPAGFGKYFLRREQLLSKLSDGYVSLSLKLSPDTDGGKIWVRVEDSGPGFDYQLSEQADYGASARSGRGLRLVRDLCESLQYQEPGNIVEAVYKWCG